TLGAQVLNNRSVEMAKKYNVELEVLSSLERKEGTIVRENTKMEKMLIRGVTNDKNVATISVIGLKNLPGVAFKLFNKLAQYKINLDMILQSVGRGGTKDITFTVARDQADNAIKAIESLKSVFEYDSLTKDENVAKVSIVGAGMESHPGVAAKMFEALYDADVNIRMIASSEIKISVLIDESEAAKAVQAVHDAFIG
ncbi:MAG: ACT domain-containing protein, partial [Clostridia bacterium]|nr:ACT domain-containing protein [Clostridia bacterium]